MKECKHSAQKTASLGDKNERREPFQRIVHKV